MINHLTSIKCRFCREFLSEDSTDDINNHICTRCWKKINGIFIIAEIKFDKEQTNDNRKDNQNDNQKTKPH